jgi:hypothetical protein
VAISYRLLAPARVSRAFLFLFTFVEQGPLRISKHRIADLGVTNGRKREVCYGSHNQYRGFYRWNDLFWDEPAGLAEAGEVKNYFSKGTMVFENYKNNYLLHSATKSGLTGSKNVELNPLVLSW